MRASSGATRAAIERALAQLDAAAGTGPARGFATTLGALEPGVEANMPAPSWAGFPTPWFDPDVAPVAVTRWFERALGEYVDVNASADVIAWVHVYGESFRPDLDGLFSQYRRAALAAELRDWSPPDRAGEPNRIVAWHIAWTVSRGGLRGLITGLARSLAGDDTERTIAALLIGDVALNVTVDEPPTLGYGYQAGPPKRERRRDVASLLRQAALVGVVPHVVAHDALRKEPPARPAGAGPLPPRPPAPARQMPAPPVPRREPEASRTPLLAGSIVALVVLAGSALAVAKWLFGWFSVDVEGSTAADDVQCTVFAPPAASAGSSVLVQVFAHLPEEADAARAVARELDTAARLRGFRSLYDRVPRGARLDFELRLPGLRIDDPVASLVWQGRTEAVQFGVTVPEAMPPRSVIGTVSISRDGAPVGHVKFTLKVGADTEGAEPEPQGVEAKRYRVAFVSYASRDRDEVLRRVQMLHVAGLRYFQDVLTLEAGENWSEAIERAIRESDVFLLFWSSGAKDSGWVRREVDYALALKAGDDLAAPEIRPVIIEGPPVIPPWDDLTHLHFNDRVLYFMSGPKT